MSDAQIGTNWSGNYVYGASALHRPGSLDELQGLVAAASALRALGSRHSFTSIADSAELVTLDALPGEIVADATAETVSVPGHTTYSALAEALRHAGLALHNMASLPHISVAGAVATGPPRSGDRNGNPAPAVGVLEMVTGDGELLTVAQGDPEFDGCVVGLGALGLVTRVTLAVEPAYQVRQRVFPHVSWNTLY